MRNFKTQTSRKIFFKKIDSNELENSYELFTIQFLVIQLDRQFYIIIYYSCYGVIEISRYTIVMAKVEDNIIGYYYQPVTTKITDYKWINPSRK